MLVETSQCIPYLGCALYVKRNDYTIISFLYLKKKNSSNRKRNFPMISLRRNNCQALKWDLRFGNTFLWSYARGSMLCLWHIRISHSEELFWWGWFFEAPLTFFHLELCLYFLFNVNGGQPLDNELEFTKASIFISWEEVLLCCPSLSGTLGHKQFLSLASQVADIIGVHHHT